MLRAGGAAGGLGAGTKVISLPVEIASLGLLVVTLGTAGLRAAITLGTMTLGTTGLGATSLIGAEATAGVQVGKPIQGDVAGHKAGSGVATGRALAA